MKRWHEETAKARRNHRDQYAKGMPLGRFRKNRFGSCNCWLCSNTKKVVAKRRLPTWQEERADITLREQLSLIVQLR